MVCHHAVTPPDPHPAKRVMSGLTEENAQVNHDPSLSRTDSTSGPVIYHQPSKLEAEVPSLLCISIL